MNNLEIPKYCINCDSSHMLYDSVFGCYGCEDCLSIFVYAENDPEYLDRDKDLLQSLDVTESAS